MWTKKWMNGWIALIQLDFRRNTLDRAQKNQTKRIELTNNSALVRCWEANNPYCYTIDSNAPRDTEQHMLPISQLCWNYISYCFRWLPYSFRFMTKTTLVFVLWIWMEVFILTPLLALNILIGMVLKRCLIKLLSHGWHSFHGNIKNNLFN